MDQVRDRYQRLSPIVYGTHIDTAVLMLQGQEDQRCPLGQSEELYANLLRFTRKPLRMVVYPGGSHSLASSGRPSHRVGYHRRLVDWVVRYAEQSDGGIERRNTDETAAADVAAS